jgi:hypothetical protein
MLTLTHPWIEVGDDLLLDLYTGTQIELMLHDPQKPNQDYWLIEHRCQAGVTRIFEGNFGEATERWAFLKKAVVPLGTTGDRVGTIPPEPPPPDKRWAAYPKWVGEWARWGDDMLCPVCEKATIETQDDVTVCHGCGWKQDNPVAQANSAESDEGEIPPEDVDYGSWRG